MGEGSTTSLRETPTLVVGVGASAGGLADTRQLLGALPVDSGMAFVLVQHTATEHEGLLPELFGPSTSMPVVAAEAATTLRPNHVYVSTTASSFAVCGGKLEPFTSQAPSDGASPIDDLFRSLALGYGARAAGILLSVTGSEGLRGLAAIQGAGGLTLTDPATRASQSRLPGATASRVVDLVLPIFGMATALERFAGLPEGAPPASTPPESGRVAPDPRVFTEDDLARITSLVEARGGFDIDIYKSSTIERRVLRRMLLAGLERKEDYFQRLHEDAHEHQKLLADLQIGVTEFFRDPGAFDALKSSVIDAMPRNLDGKRPVRVWVAGCATGEEAYSLAIVMLDVFKELRADPLLQFFATDVDTEALGFARAGVYPESVAEFMPPALLAEYFTRVDHGKLQVRDVVRQLVSFAHHDLCKDPPFSRIDLVSCRNVLIYLKPAAQHAALRAMHFSLQPEGHLWLGTSETANAEPQLFQEISKKWRIYRKRGQADWLSVSRAVRRHTPPGQSAVALGQRTRALTQGDPKSGQRSGSSSASRSATEPPPELVRMALVRAHVPPAVVISAAGEVLYIHGDLHEYLRFPQGAPQRDLWSLLAPPLATRIRTASYKARRDANIVKLRATFESPPDGARDVEVTLTPAPDVGQDALVIAFETVGERTQRAVLGSEPLEHKKVLEQLERELRDTREELQSTAAELEATTEELRLSSEESSSIHEELQAVNEELEATTEELRSLNQELTTVNTQLTDKLGQLELTNDDLSNFFSSTRLATVFLDPDARIRRFTPAAHDLLGVVSDHVGWKVSELERELLQAGLYEEALVVLNGLTPKSRDLETSDGRWIVRQVLPYRTRDRRTAGVVVTFQDVTEFKRTEFLLRRREAQQAVVSELGLKALETRNLGEFLDEAMRDVERVLGSDSCCILELQPGGSGLLLRAGLGWAEGLTGRTIVPARANAEPGAMLRSREPTLVNDLSTEPRLEPHDLLLKHGLTSCLSCVVHNDRGVYGLIGAYAKAKNCFTPDDASFLQTMANVVGSAVSAFQADLRAELEQSTNRLLSEPGDVSAVTRRILLEIGNALRADVCELWRKDVGGDQLCCECFETPSEPNERVGLKAKLVPETIAPGVGLVGTTWNEGHAHWLPIQDVGKNRGRSLHAMRLSEGIALPIVAGHQTILVMAFFLRHHLSWDDQMLGMLDRVGRSIGTFVTSRHVAFEQARLAAIVASSDDAILSKDLMGTVQSWNPGAERIYGYTASEMVGHPVSLLFPDHLKAEGARILEKITSGGRIESYETVRVRKDGTLIDVSVTVSPIAGDDGSVVGASTIARDITDRKRAEKRLEEADRQKDQFLAMLGHELRNPLAAVRNATELLKLKHEADPTTTRIREILDRQTRHMAHLMDGLLDVSRIIRNKIDLKFEPVDFGRVVQEVVDDYAARPQRHSLQFCLELDRERAWVRGDSVRLTQIVDNLIGNALKFTQPDGSIVLTLTERFDQVIFSVKDSGRGIAPELLPHVFDVFRQAQQSLDRTAGGLGLGLALVKLLTDLHAGSVEAKSEGHDHGAEFIVRLPSIETPVRGRVPRSKPGVQGFDILVVEDNRDAATLLCELLEVAGHATDLAISAEAAWDLLQQRTPEVVLCDLGLPGDMTGFDLARRIRAEARFGPMRIIALSGYGRPEDKIASRQAGFDAHLTKPVDFDSLQSILTQQAS